MEAICSDSCSPVGQLHTHCVGGCVRGRAESLHSCKQGTQAGSKVAPGCTKPTIRGCIEDPIGVVTGTGCGPIIQISALFFRHRIWMFSPMHLSEGDCKWNRFKDILKTCLFFFKSRDNLLGRTLPYLWQHWGRVYWYFCYLLFQTQLVTYLFNTSLDG